MRFFSQSSQISVSTTALLPLIDRHTMLWRSLKRSNHPVLGLKSLSPSLLANSYDFDFKIGPLIGIFWLRLSLNHSYKVASTFSWADDLWRFLTGEIVDFSYDSTIFSLFFNIVLKVFGRMSNLTATSFFSAHFPSQHIEWFHILSNEIAFLFRVGVAILVWP